MKACYFKIPTTDCECFKLKFENIKGDKTVCKQTWLFDTNVG